jgi:hypothetical protein
MSSLFYLCVLMCCALFSRDSSMSCMLQAEMKGKKVEQETQ